MEIIFLNSKTGEQLTMPVTPPDFHVETGRSITQLDMAQTGQVNLPGLEALFNEQQTFLLPSSARNYTVSGYSGDPYTVVNTLTRWSLSGDVLRLIVTETPVNLPILLAPVRYGEEDGTGDVYVTLTMRQYRELATETTEQADTGNAGPGTAPGGESRQHLYGGPGRYHVGHCRRYYGDGRLAWKLASYNGIKNANLIYPGQKVTIPDRSLL